MENISLAVVTNDIQYGKALGQAVLHLCSRVMIKVIGKEEFFDRTRGSDKGDGDEEGQALLESIDLILWDGDEAEEVYGGRIVLLSEKPSMALKNFGEKRFCLYKYSQAQYIVSSIFEIYGFLTGRRTVNIKSGQVRLLAFTSWSGGSGCTSVAMAVAQELCRFRDRRVMYVSLEETESTGEFINSPVGVKGVGVYLYHLFKNQKRMTSVCVEICGGAPDVESYVVRDDFGVEAFAPTAGRNPLSSLTSEELETFIASLTDSGRYDVIILDLGSGLSGVHISSMEMAERICLIAKPSQITVRETQYLQYLICCCGDGIAEKIVKVENMTEERIEDTEVSGGEYDMVDTAVHIVRSGTFVQEGENKRIFLDGGFGRSVEILTDMLAEM